MKLNKQNKIFYYFRSFSRIYIPSTSFNSKIKHLKSKLNSQNIAAAETRIAYYNKHESIASTSHKYTIKDLKDPKTPKAYYFDSYEYARYFNPNTPLNFVFGDVTEVPEVPSIVKSRPISENNQNSILLNLDKARHFVFVQNDKNFLEKKPSLFGRAAVYQEHRYLFFDLYFDHPLCNIGQVNKTGGNPKWLKPKISIEKHLEYKFILSLQGNDVATNLKWIMSSNSIAVMPKPTLETWFMEGKLIGGKHFIEIKSDYSDLEEQLNFYNENPDECLMIIENAHAHCRQFFNKDVEDYCSLRVLEKYFYNTKSM
ncbi:glycosyl transferase family 90 [Kaistella polysaccharea]|uniref:glycosyl transferase family 90 n=1 Tax=Kaistella polysaccharea TaxID=2878534 RepID=UPI001CF43EB0|nr:glycosyl transferase family 90 [Kaistella polysaccharea]